MDAFYATQCIITTQIPHLDRKVTDVVSKALERYLNELSMCLWQRLECVHWHLLQKNRSLNRQTKILLPQNRVITLELSMIYRPRSLTNFWALLSTMRHVPKLSHYLQITMTELIVITL